MEGQLIYSGTVSSFFMKARPEKYPEVRVYWNIENLIPEPDLGRNICMKQMEQVFRTAVRYSAQCINMEYRLFTDRVMELLKPWAWEALPGRSTIRRSSGADGKGDRQYHHTEP